MAIGVWVLTATNGWYVSNDFEFAGAQPNWVGLGRGIASLSSVGGAADIDVETGGLYVITGDLSGDKAVAHYTPGSPYYDEGTWATVLTESEVETGLSSSNVDVNYVYANQSTSGKVYVLIRDNTNNKMAVAVSSNYGATWAYRSIPTSYTFNGYHSMWANGSTIFYHWAAWNGSAYENRISVSTNDGSSWTDSDDIASAASANMTMGVPGSSARVMTQDYRVTVGPVTNHMMTEVSSGAALTRKDFPISTDRAFFGQYSHWIDPGNWSHQRILCLNDTVIYTNDAWDSRSFGDTWTFSPQILTAHPSYTDYLIIGASSSGDDVLYVANGEGGTPASRCDISVNGAGAATCIMTGDPVALSDYPLDSAHWYVV